MVRWRPIQSEWNLKNAPWPGALGIEEDNDSFVVPAIVCWFTRGWDNPEAMVAEVCRLHNAAVGTAPDFDPYLSDLKSSGGKRRRYDGRQVSEVWMMERIFCGACGTVTSNGRCDCTKLGLGAQRLWRLTKQEWRALDRVIRRSKRIKRADGQAT